MAIDNPKTTPSTNQPSITLSNKDIKSLDAMISNYGGDSEFTTTEVVRGSRKDMNKMFNWGESFGPLASKELYVTVTKGATLFTLNKGGIPIRGKYLIISYAVDGSGALDWGITDIKPDLTKAGSVTKLR